MPDIDAILKAAERLAGAAIETPVLRHPELDARTGAAVHIKAEPLQRTGSFKFRGAYNRLSQLSPAERRAGVVAFSSGNHAQAVALAAKLLGTPATIVMPSDAPRIKVDSTRGHGAEVVFYDRATENREQIAQDLAAKAGAVVVPAFNDPDIICGQGTAGLELMRYAEAQNLRFDAILTPLGGGGLLSGVALALKAHNPAIEVYGVEPEHYDDVKTSLAAGEIRPLTGFAPTLCDALQTQAPGSWTFPILKAHVTAVATVTDQETQRAMAFAARHLKLVAEPGGSAALAALLAGKVDLRGKTAALVISGGNVDPEVYADALTAFPAP